MDNGSSSDTEGIRFESECYLCRSNQKSAELVLLGTVSGYYFCGACRGWFESDLQTPPRIFPIRNQRKVRALEYYYASQLETVAPMIPELKQAMKSFYYKIQDFYFWLYRQAYG